MKTEKESRVLTERSLSADLVVVGGGLSGLMCAVAAARGGIKVVLVQDRPVLGGNASSEIRMGICGAHGYGRKETGILEELQLNNVYRNPRLRYTRWDDEMYSLAILEKNITLILNTSVQEVQMDGNLIKSVRGWNVNEYCYYNISGTLFADCSGDSILRLSGAEFRRGREKMSEFDEDFLMNPDGDDKTMGNSILLQLRKCDNGHIPFIPPPWAYHFDDEFFAKRSIGKEFNRSAIRPWPENNNFWWIEYGGNIDTVADANAIQFELKKVAYGVWEYMKNHPDGRCRDYELDWIGSIPGKRESARFVGDYILNQNDIMAGGHFDDNVCYGGWTIDDHHPDAFRHEGGLSVHHVPPSPFGIPYRIMYSRNIGNLFFAGRNVSCTHMGLSATRVMATCALMGQVIGTAAAIAFKNGISPRGVYEKHIRELQAQLLEDDVMIPDFPRKVSDITLRAKTAYPVLQNSIDRDMHDDDNGAWLAEGESVLYEWGQPEQISNCRFVFDTVLVYDDKRMRKLEAVMEPKEMPPMLPRKLRIEALVNGSWQLLLEEDDIHCRLFRRSWPAVNATAMRVTVLKVWGADSKAHLYTIEYR